MPKIDRRVAVIENSTEATVNPGDEANQAVRVNVVAGSAGASHTDDAAFTPGSGDVTPIGALVDDTATDTVDEGDVGVVRMGPDRILYTKIHDGSLSASVRNTGSSDSLNVAITDGSGNHITSFGGGTQYTEGDTDASLTGNVVMWEDAGDAVVATSATNPLPVEIIAGGGSGGTALADEDTFTEGTTSFTPIGGVFNDALASDPSAGEAAAARITSDRALHVNLRGASGTEIGTNSNPVQIGDAGGNISIDDGGNTITVDGTVAISSITTAVVPGTGATNLGKAEDAAHTTGDVGVMALAVRNDGGSVLAGTDGDYVPLTTDSSGNLRVTGGGGGTQYTEGDTDSSITGNAIMFESNTGSNTLSVVNNSTPLPVSDAGGSLTVDVGTALPAGTNNIGDVDVLSVVPGTGATNLGKAEDAAHASGDTGVMALAVRQDTQTALGADGDYVPLTTGPMGSLRVVSAGYTTIIDTTLTRPANTTAYAAGDEVTDTGGAVRELTAIARTSGGSGTIANVTACFSSNWATKPSLELWVFDTTTAPATDNAAFDVDDTEINTLVAVIPLYLTYIGDATANTGNFSMSTAPGSTWAFKCSGSDDLFVRVVIRNAGQAGANSDVIKLRFAVWQD